MIIMLVSFLEKPFLLKEYSFWIVITFSLWIYFNEGHIFQVPVNSSCLTFEGPVLSQNRASLIEEVSWFAYHHFISFSMLKYFFHYRFCRLTCTWLFLLSFRNKENEPNFYQQMEMRLMFCLWTGDTQGTRMEKLWSVDWWFCTVLTDFAW